MFRVRAAASKVAPGRTVKLPWTVRSVPSLTPAGSLLLTTRLSRLGKVRLCGPVPASVTVEPPAKRLAPPLRSMSPRTTTVWLDICRLPRSQARVPATTSWLETRTAGLAEEIRL